MIALLCAHPQMSHRFPPVQWQVLRRKIRWCQSVDPPVARFGEALHQQKSGQRSGFFRNCGKQSDPEILQITLRNILRERKVWIEINFEVLLLELIERSVRKKCS